MKGKILALIFLLIFTSFLTLHAQWAKTYGGSEDDYPSSILQTSDGGYIVAGSTSSYGAGTTDIWILKFNTWGDIEWQKTYGEYYGNSAYSIQKTNDGGYIVGGSYVINYLGYEFGVMKLDPDGNIEWLKTFGDEFSNTAYSLQQTIDGGYIVAGISFFVDTQTADIVILKLSVDGTEEWSKTYGGTGDDRAYSILLTDEGGYIVAGYTSSFGAGDNDIWILKLASDGSIEWQKTYGGSESEETHSILHTSDGGYIIAGYSASFGAGLDFLVIKLNTGGEIEWQKTYGGSRLDVAYSIQQTFDGGYIVAGETESFGAGNKDMWILKLSILGNIEWQRMYGGGQNEEASSIQQTVDGGYIVAGFTDTYGAGEQDILILKLFSNGDINSFCGFVKESNAVVFDTDISPADSYIDTEFADFPSNDFDITPRESEAVVYSLCSGVQHTLSISASSGGTTVPQPDTYIYDHAKRISLGVNPEGGYNFIGWSGDVSSTERPLYITMDSDKSIKANFIENVIDDLIEEVKKAPCFIATAAFGSPIHPYVKTLQDFKDKYLMSSRAGRKLVNLYYKYSPHIAELITNHKALRTVARIWLCLL